MLLGKVEKRQLVRELKMEGGGMEGEGKRNKGDKSGMESVWELGGNGNQKSPKREQVHLVDKSCHFIAVSLSIHHAE